MAAELVVTNANVITMDARCPRATAFAVDGGRFCAIGADGEVRHWTGRETEQVDLGGLTVVPGLIETHSHLSLYAMVRLQAECRTPPNRTIEDVKARLAEAAAAVGRGQWVKGWGFDDTLITERRHLGRTDLDQAVPDNPVFVSHASGHIAYVNSAALAIAGIGTDTPQPAGGEIQKDAAGRPTGLLLEDAAQDLVLRHIPRYRAGQLKRAMLEGIAAFHRHGITSVHDAAIGYFRHERPIIKAYRELEGEGRLSLAVYLGIVERAYRQLQEVGLGTGFGSRRLKLGCVKFFQDGSIQALTAALDESYRNAPGIRGQLLYAQDEFNELVERYHVDGHQIAVHANGDRAIQSVIEAMERAQRRRPRSDARHMLIHCQLAGERQIEAMKRLGIVPSYFVNHVYYWGDRHLELFLGEERAARIDPLASTVSWQLPFTLHSDLPITPVNPFFSIHCAVNRQTSHGRVLGPEQRISPWHALLAYTRHAAYCSFEEESKGTIGLGKEADFAVLSSDPFQVPVNEIKDIKVIRTAVAGQWVYDHDW